MTTEKAPQHTSGAIQAAVAIKRYYRPFSDIHAESLAEIIDRESGARELLEALEELVSAVHDAFRRQNAGDMDAIKSNMISATIRQAEVAIRKARGEGVVK